MRLECVKNIGLFLYIYGGWDINVYVYLYLLNYYRVRNLTDRFFYVRR